MRSRSRRRRTVVYLLFVVTALAFMVVSVRYPPFNEAIHSYTVDRMAVIYRVLNAPVAFTKSVGNAIGVHLATVQKNKMLVAENTKLRAWRAEAMFLRQENDTLQELLNMVSDNAVKPITARVLTDSNTPYSRTVLISAGRSDGVQKGQAVLGQSGLVGRVLFVGAQSSRVLLLSDPNTRIPVKVLETGQMAILRGKNTRYPELILIEGDQVIQPGMHLVTSGAGGIFAAGLPVGAVHQVDTGVRVRPYNSLTNLDLVVVHNRPVTGILQDVPKALEAE